MVAVVQLVEPQVVILVVAGSSPVSHPIDLPYPLWYGKFNQLAGIRIGEDAALKTVTGNTAGSSSLPPAAQ